MFDMISPLANLLWPIIIGVAGILGMFIWGQKKKREGRIQERDRALAQRDAAADEAVKIRDKAAAKPTSKQREETSRWEK